MQVEVQSKYPKKSITKHDNDTRFPAGTAETYSCTYKLTLTLKQQHSFVIKAFFLPMFKTFISVNDILSASGLSSLNAYSRLV